MRTFIQTELKNTYGTEAESIIKCISPDLCDILDVFRIYNLRRRIIALSAAENKNYPLLANWIPELESANDKRDKMFSKDLHTDRRF